MEKKVVSHSILVKVAFVLLILILIFSVIGNVVLGYVGYKYFKLRDAYKTVNTSYSSLKELYNNSLPQSQPDSATNPFIVQNSKINFGVADNIVTVSKSDKQIGQFTIDLENGKYKIEETMVSHDGNSIALITSTPEGSDGYRITRLSIIDLVKNKVIQVAQTGDKYSSKSGNDISFIESPIFSNDDKTLYLGNSYNGSGLFGFQVNMSNYKIMDSCSGSLLGIMPNKSEINASYFKNYAGDLIMGNKSYYAIGGADWTIDFVDPSTCKVVNKGLLPWDDQTNTNLTTFYNEMNVK